MTQATIMVRFFTGRARQLHKTIALCSRGVGYLSSGTFIVQVSAALMK